MGYARVKGLIGRSREELQEVEFLDTVVRRAMHPAFQPAKVQSRQGEEEWQQR